MSTSDQVEIVTPGMNWSPEQVQAAIDGNYYDKIGGSKASKLQITGAVNRWKKFEKDIYIPSLKIAGDPESIRTVLERAGYTNDQIEQIVSSAYTKANFSIDEGMGGYKGAFDAEVEQLKALKKSQKDASGEKDDSKNASVKVVYDNLEAIIEGLKTAEVRKATRKPKEVAEGQETDKKKGANRGPKVPLAQRLNDLPTGKCLDCSDMEPTGTKIRPVDTPSEASKKICVPGLAICSSSHEKYCQALALLGPDYAHYGQKYLEIQKSREAAAQQKQANKATKAAAPKAKAEKPVAAPPAPTATVPKSVPAKAVAKAAAPAVVAAPTVKPSAPLSKTAAPVASAPVASAPVAAVKPVAQPNLKALPGKLPRIGNIAIGSPRS